MNPGGSVREHRIRARACAAAASALLVASLARAEDRPTSLGPAPKPAPSRSASSTAWTVVAYLPNRLFDLCDVMRLHVRVGTGWAAGARVSRYAPVFVGDYGALWLGLAGPRGRAKVPWPVGTESQSGIEAGPAAAGSRAHSPVYGVGEVGAGGMLYVVGADVGVDVYELADFLAGFALVDFARDDF
jgi:hypothetical protein